MAKRKRSKSTVKMLSFRAYAKQTIEQSKAGTYVTPDYIKPIKKQRTEKQKQADIRRSETMKMIHTYRRLIEWETGVKLARKGWSYERLKERWQQVKPFYDEVYQSPAEPEETHWWQDVSDPLAKQYRELLEKGIIEDLDSPPFGWDTGDVLDDPLLVELRRREQEAQEERERKKRERAYESDAISRGMYTVDTVTGEILVFPESVQRLLQAMDTTRIPTENKSQADYMNIRNSLEGIKTQLMSKVSSMSTQDELDEYGGYIDERTNEINEALDSLDYAYGETLVQNISNLSDLLFGFTPDDSYMDSYQEEYDE